MPTKKIKKSKAVKKILKKTAVKKPDPKKKKVIKVAKKSAPKVAKKLSTKTAKKQISKTLKPTKKEKKSILKNATKKADKKAESTKQLTPKESAKQRKALTKSILANSNKKVVEVAKEPEKKGDSIQRIILAHKNESRAKVTFKVGDYSVYPSHGIGKIIGIEKTEILGRDLSCYLMYFEKEKLTIKIPMSSADKIGLRHLVSKAQMDEVFVILRSGVKKLKGMWSRRAQEYETKINSGDITLLAEVLRDLTRDIEDGERSYSERIIYETAIYRLAGEYSAIYGSSFEEAKDKITLTAKDKLNSEGKIIQKDDFDDFDSDIKSDLDEDDEEETEDEEEDEDDYDDDDDDTPRKGRKRRK